MICAKARQFSLPPSISENLHAHLLRPGFPEASLFPAGPPCALLHLSLARSPCVLLHPTPSILGRTESLVDLDNLGRHKPLFGMRGALSSSQGDNRGGILAHPGNKVLNLL